MNYISPQQDHHPSRRLSWIFPEQKSRIRKISIGSLNRFGSFEKMKTTDNI